MLRIKVLDQTPATIKTDFNSDSDEEIIKIEE